MNRYFIWSINLNHYRIRGSLFSYRKIAFQLKPAILSRSFDRYIVSTIHCMIHDTGVKSNSTQGVIQKVLLGVGPNPLFGLMNYS